ncbi:MAG: sporulation protein YtfJ [Oscillospiraceae bacterium]|nr:sporulation protein YtfJ [Oscillospiraceae bacterium]
MEDSFSNVVENIMLKLKEIVETEVLIGQPINVKENITIIPVSKVSLGFALGGADKSKDKKERMAINLGSGAGVSFTPIGFLVINGENGKEVKLMELGSKNQLKDLIEGIPDLCSMFSELFKKNQKRKPGASERGGKD